MEQTKRQRESSYVSYYDDNKRQKPSDNSNSSSKNSITRFEDLANELIYEITDYLDVEDAYKIFYNLNIRFQNLFTNSTLPLKITIPSMSKSNFQHYSTNIIIPNQHRITSIRLSNLFLVDLVFSPFSVVSNLTRLETLIVHDVELHLMDLLNYLVFLPHLTSLVIILVGQVQNINNLYYQIFRIPSLKYCKVSLKKFVQCAPLPITTNEFSPIEHLVIENTFHLDELDALLSYVPQLRRLRIYYLNKSRNRQTASYSTVLKHLTHVSLFTDSITFDEFESWIKSLASQLEVFHISIRYDMEFLNANRWERLIQSHMPYLRIFDIWHINTIHTNTYNHNLGYDTVINQFRSSFWFERQWYFAYNINRKSNHHDVCFYSTDPFRRKYVLIIGELVERTCPYNEKTNKDCVRSVDIRLEKPIDDCVTYFPNVTGLKLSSVNLSQDALITTLKHILSFQELTGLLIDDPNFDLEKMIKLLHFLPNISTLMIHRVSSVGKDLVLIQRSEVYQLISNKNNIKNMIINFKCGFEETKLLINLCSQLQRLTIDISAIKFESTLRFLLSKDNNNICHLSSLCLKDVSENEIKTVKTLIESERLLDDYLLKVTNNVPSEIYLWW